MKLKKISWLGKFWFYFKRRHFMKLYPRRYFHPQLARIFFDTVWQTRMAMNQVYVAPKRVAADLPIVLVIGESQSGKSSLLSGSRQILPQSSHLNSEYEPMAGRSMPKWSATPQRLYVELPQYFLVNESAKKIPYLEQLLLAWRATGELERIHQLVITISAEVVISGETRSEFWESFSVLLENLPKPLSVSVVVTQTDRLQGFAEYFNDLSVEERQHPFGVVLAEPQFLGHQLQSGLLALAQRLKRRMWWRCQSEHLLSRRLLVAEFPEQFQIFSEKLLLSLSPCFEELPQGSGVQFSGCFFTSTIQRGQIFDLLFEEQEALFTLTEEPTHLPMLLQEKEYFVRGFFQQILFGFSRKKTKKRFAFPKILSGLSSSFFVAFIGLALVFLVGMLAWWTFDWWSLESAVASQKNLAYKILASPNYEESVRQFVVFETPHLPKILQREMASSDLLERWITNNARSFLNLRWHQEVLSFYTRNLEGKYPLASEAQKEVDLAQFDAFYGPQGILARYDAHYLASPAVQKLFYDDPALIDLYSHTKALQAILYKASLVKANLSFTAYPTDLAESIRSASFMVNGIKMNVRHHSVTAQTFDWPNLEPLQESGFSVEYLESLPSIQAFQGNWSWLRLFKTLHWQKSGASNDYQVSMPNHEFSLSLDAEVPIGELPLLFDHLSVPKNI